MPREELSEREQRVLQHLQKAKELEVTIAEYARSFEVDLAELYQVRQKLIRKGVIEGPLRSVQEVPCAEFIPVLVTLGYTAVAGDEHNMLVALVRRSGETLHQLLDRLKGALGPALEDQIFVDEINGTG